MKAEALTHERTRDFALYCKKHRSSIDDSFLYDEDIQQFEPNEENPTYIITNHQGEIIAAASLIMDEYQKRGKRARFRIFHSEMDDVACYSMLLDTLLPHIKEIENLFIFVPLINKPLSAMIERLGFSVDRFAFLLMREDMEVPEISLPEDYQIRSFKRGKDEQLWCEVRNAAFATLKGNETPITPEMIANQTKSKEYLEGGMKLLFHQEKPVGVVRGADDEYEGAPIMNIGPLAILPEYQGKGLGRCLLRCALHYAKENAYSRTILSVNGENERAKALYIQEGFRQVEGVTCYKYHLTEAHRNNEK
ncbi:GNAT family N-acetyltransferase [Neobacillus sp. Marseille-QA0830]